MHNTYKQDIKVKNSYVSAGFLLIETLIAFSILSIVVLASAYSFSLTVRDYGKAHMRLNALVSAQNTIESSWVGVRQRAVVQAQTDTIKLRAPVFKQGAGYVG